MKMLAGRFGASVGDIRAGYSEKLSPGSGPGPGVSAERSEFAGRPTTMAVVYLDSGSRPKKGAAGMTAPDVGHQARVVALRLKPARPPPNAADPAQFCPLSLRVIRSSASWNTSTYWTRGRTSSKPR